MADKDKNTEDYLDSLLNAALKSGNTDDNDNSEMANIDFSSEAKEIKEDDLQSIYGDMSFDDLMSQHEVSSASYTMDDIPAEPSEDVTPDKTLEESLENEAPDGTLAEASENEAPDGTLEESLENEVSDVTLSDESDTISDIAQDEEETGGVNNTESYDDMALQENTDSVQNDEPGIDDESDNVGLPDDISDDEIGMDNQSEDELSNDTLETGNQDTAKPESELSENLTETEIQDNIEPESRPSENLAETEIQDNIEPESRP